MSCVNAYPLCGESSNYPYYTTNMPFVNLRAGLIEPGKVSATITHRPRGTL